MLAELIKSSYVNYLPGTLKAILKTYTNWPVENVTGHHVGYTAGSLFGSVKSYSVPAESVESELVLFLDGTLVAKLISYVNWIPEEVESSHVSFSAGTLS